MSLFRQHAAPCAFPADESWVILSPIEASIKRKIEAVGTPLSEWDISINYGIKTGCNEAFIISTARRDEILAACRDEAERERTAELIRPILRGRDIKRYGYEWAELWLIATFPSRHYDIEQYPAVRDYLLSFGREKLEQTGATYIRDGQEFKARKKTNNQWFETQDSISYWEDFEQPKAMWKRVGSIIRFCYNENGTLGLDSTCFATGKCIEYICCLLNSPMGHYMLRNSPTTGTGDLLISVQAIEPIMVPRIDEDKRLWFKSQLSNLCSVDEGKISEIIFDLYGLSEEERCYIVSNYA